MNKATTDLMFQATTEATSEWGSPPWLFAMLNREFRFTLDAAASDANHLLPKYFTKETDGLASSWAGHRVYINPPYGEDLDLWVKKAAFEARFGMATSVMLLPSRTDRACFHDYVMGVADEVRFIRGRLKFVGAKNTAPFPSMIVVWLQGPGWARQTWYRPVDPKGDYRAERDGPPAD